MGPGRSGWPSAVRPRYRAVSATVEAKGRRGSRLGSARPDHLPAAQFLPGLDLVAPSPFPLTACLQLPALVSGGAR